MSELDSNLLLNIEQYSLIYKVSYITLFTCLYAIYNKTPYNFAMLPGCIFISSIIYWYKPDYSWRRYFDMIIVKSCIGYQYATAYNAQYAIPYYTITTIGILFYPIGIYYYTVNNSWASTYSHIAVHILVNIGHIILYSGKIRD
jgi:hypothetical protein